MNKNLHVTYHFDSVSDVLKPSIQEYVEHHITHKMDSYFKKIFSKEGAEITIKVSVKKLEDDRFDGHFQFVIDGKQFDYSTGNKPFRSVQDLVAHAFDHLKERMAD
ncbi:MAG TPA: hypothetical protein PKC14_04680 [Candidatus Absconditabacterales bacterium]|nr:hypothetical protein [Candidatus Absconditabacterales bacterium]